MDNYFISFHPVIIKSLLYMQAHISLNIDVLEDDRKKFDLDYAVALMQLIECAIRCIPCESLEQFSLVDKAVALEAKLGWEYFVGASGIIEILENSLKRWVVEISRNPKPHLKQYQLNLISAGFQLLSTFIQRYSLSNLFKPIDFVKSLEDLVWHVNAHICKSEFFHDLLTKLPQLSIFCNSKSKDGRLRDPDNLPSLGIIR